MNTLKICIDAGHNGKYNRSPLIPDYYESEMNWKLHLMLKEELEAYGAEVKITRNSLNEIVGGGDTKNGLTLRGAAAKGCDLFLSVHSNACNDASVDYPLACCCVSGAANDLGKALADKVAEIMGTRQTGRIINKKGNGGDYYGVLRGAASVGVPGVLLEHSFHTNARAAEWLLNEDNLRKLAKADAEVIAKHYGLEKPKATAQKPAEGAQEAFTPYRVKVICDGLNIRKTPAWNASDVVGTITDKGVYTIVEETDLNGTKFGKLKSGKGWISLGAKYVKKI